MKCMFCLLMQLHLCPWAGEAWRNPGDVWKRDLSTLKYRMIPRTVNMISWEVVPCLLGRPEIHPNPVSSPWTGSWRRGDRQEGLTTWYSWGHKQCNLCEMDLRIKQLELVYGGGKRWNGTTTLENGLVASYEVNTHFSHDLANTASYLPQRSENIQY